MNIITRTVSRDYLRNGKLNIQGSSSSYLGVSSYGSLSGNYLPATSNADGTYTVDLSKVTFTGNIIAEGEVTAYGSGESSGSIGNVTIYDGLDSTDTTIALSANQGRILKGLIDNLDVGDIDLSGYYSKSDIDTLISGYSKTDHTHSDYSLNTHTHTFASLTSKPTTLAGYGITDAASSSHTHSNYVDKESEQTINGTKTFNNNITINRGFSIVDDRGYGIIGVNSTGWTGLPTDGEAIGIGASDVPVYIRTSADDLYHYRKDTLANYTILDSYNVGNYKSGDSTKFDGYSLRGTALSGNTIDCKITYYIDASSYSTSTFYPVVFPSSSKTLHCEVLSVGGSADASYNMNKLSFSFSGAGWSDTPKGLTVHFYNCYDSSEKSIGCIGMGNEGGMKCVWVRGGLKYYFTSNIKPTFSSTAYTNGNEIFVTGTSLNGGSNTKVTTYWTPQSTSGLGTMYHSAGLALGGGINVAGAATLKSTLAVTGTSTFTGNSTFSNNIDVAGATKVKNVTYKPTNKATLSSAGWYRFATSTQANNGGGTYIFSIRRSYYNTNNESYIVVATVDYNGVNWTQIAGHYNTQLITQIRCTYTSNSTMYFDLYYSGTVANEVFVNAIGDCTLQIPTLTTSTLTTTTPFSLNDGYKSGVKTAYAMTLFRNASSGGCYIRLGANAQLTKSWAVGTNTSHQYSWWYKDTSAGTDTQKMYLTSDAKLQFATGTDGRYLKIDNEGGFKCYQTTGTAGWTMGTYYYTNAGTVTGSYCAYGSGDTLSFYYMGKAYNDYVYKFNNSTTNPYLSFTQGSTWYIQGYNGYLYIGAGNTKSLRIDSSGNCLSVGEVTAHSDKRLKTDIKPLTVRGELNPVTYTKDGKESIGFIADEVKEVYPELVITDESTDEKYLSLNYAQLTAVLYAEIKELKERITQLENK